MKLVNRLLAYSRCKLKGNSTLLASKSTRFRTHKTSSIIINSGVFQVGFCLPGVPDVSTYNHTGIFLSENSKLLINGNVFIAPGVTIRIGKDATLIFHGDNFIGHNTSLLCNYHIEIGKYSGISWSCNLIDDDGHRFYRQNKELRNLKRKLLIGDYVGIQMNVLIPSAITIGNGSVISAGTILRENIPPNTLTYSKPQTVRKHGISTGFELKAQS